MKIDFSVEDATELSFDDNSFDAAIISNALRQKLFSALGVWMTVYKRKQFFMVSTYAMAHFLVDFACAFLVFRAVSSSPDRYLGILLYNFCAFAAQMPIGVLADRIGRNYLFAILGCALTAAGYGFASIPLAAVIIIGLGNGLFHIGGGVDVLNISGERAAALGVFVSPGAFGVYFGTLLGRGIFLPASPVAVALIAAAALIFASRRIQGGEYPGNATFSLGGSTYPNAFLAVLCFFLVVCLRSYMGTVFDFPWKSSGHWGVVLVCAVVFGKIAGGFIADKFGAAKTTCVSLAIAALLFFILNVPTAGVLSFFLFNMTMPITLWAMARAFPGAKGFAFGLLSFGLFIGFLPVYLGVYLPYGASWPFSAAAIASLLLLWAGLRKAEA